MPLYLPDDWKDTEARNVTERAQLLMGYGLALGHLGDIVKDQLSHAARTKPISNESKHAVNTAIGTVTLHTELIRELNSELRKLRLSMRPELPWPKKSRVDPVAAHSESADEPDEEPPEEPDDVPF